MDPKEEADKLRAEAKEILNKLLGVRLPEETSHTEIDRLVDCIIGAAVLEMSTITNEVITQTFLADDPFKHGPN